MKFRNSFSQATAISTSSLESQAVVEFAIILPILLILLLGLVNVGLLVNAQVILTQAAWEGARVGATLDQAGGEGDAEILSAIESAAQGLPAPVNVQVEIVPDEAVRRAMSWPAPRGDPLRVTLEYPLRMSL
ncbi:MAG: TadE/TadG family type IV pilus assembly protein, partial [Anaerolineales bacterium]